jgi:DNA-binding FrmR family transcriptional regulator
MKSDKAAPRPTHSDHLSEEIQNNVARRLKRAEGQMRGVQRMLQQQRYCPDILVQISAIHESLRAVERILLQNHLRHCATNALRSGDEAQAQRTYRELTELFYKHAR